MHPPRRPPNPRAAVQHHVPLRLPREEAQQPLVILAPRLQHERLQRRVGFGCARVADARQFGAFGVGLGVEGGTLRRASYSARCAADCFCIDLL